MSYLVDPLTLAAHHGLNWIPGDPVHVFARQRRVRVCFHEIEALSSAFSLYVNEVDGRFGVIATRDEPVLSAASEIVAIWPVLTRLHPFGIIQDVTGGLKLSLARDRSVVVDEGGQSIFDGDHLDRSVEAIYRAARRFVSSSAILENALTHVGAADLLERAGPEIEAKHAFGRPLWTVKQVDLTVPIADWALKLDPSALSSALTVYFALLTSRQNEQRVHEFTEARLASLAKYAAELSLVMPEGGFASEDAIGASFLVEDDAILTYGGHGSSRFFGAG